MRVKVRVDPLAVQEVIPEGTPASSTTIEQWTAALIDALKQVMDQGAPPPDQNRRYMYD